MGDALPAGLLRWCALALALACCAPPVWMAWRALANRRRGWIVAGFCVLPLLVIWVYKLKLLNALLLQGVLEYPVVIGTPAFVLAVFAFMVAATGLTWRWLQTLDAGAAPGSPPAAMATQAVP
jgi:hypothetical protein